MDGFAYSTRRRGETAGEHVLLVTLDRPEVMNAINTQMGLDLLDLWTRLTAEPERARCVVLTGAGDRAFCAGGDLKERNGMSDETWRASTRSSSAGSRRWSSCPVPVIAAVNGHASAAVSRRPSRATSSTRRGAPASA